MFQDCERDHTISRPYENQIRSKGIEMADHRFKKYSHSARQRIQVVAHMRVGLGV